MKIKYTYRFVTGEELTIEIDELDHILLTELDRLELNHNQTETRRHVSLDTLNRGENLFSSVSDDPAELMDAALAIKALHRAIDRLLPEQAELIKAVFFDETTQAEIARHNQVSRSAISQQISVALKKLKEFLG